VNHDGTPVLSICVPTFNREQNLERQLAFLLRDCSGFSNIEIIVSDNCSTDATEEVCAKLGARIRYNRNSTNMGPVPNFQVLAGLAAGRYFWLVADDDVLDPGIVRSVISAISSDPSYVFINHRIDSGPNGRHHFDRVISEGPSDFSDGKSFITEACRTILGLSQLMFTTACVFRKSSLDQIIAKHSHLAAPLFYSFYCASRGPAVVIRRPMLTNNWREISWADSADEVVGRLIPSIIWRLPRYGYGVGFTWHTLVLWLRGHRRQVRGEIRRSLSRTARTRPN